MTAPITHILPLSHIRRTRLLPAVGNVLVRRGQKVNAMDVVAETYRFPGHQLMNVGSALQVENSEEIEQLIQVKPGDQIQTGDVLAQKKGLFRKVVRAQHNGTIVSTNDGQIWIETHGEKFELRAGYSGEIDEVISERGVIISCHGALIQAAWGNGKIEDGVIVYHAQSADEELKPEMLDISSRGGILFGGYCGSAETFRVAAQLSMRGIILGSMAAELVPLAISMPYPIILTEGFGRFPVNHNAYNLITSNKDRQVSILASVWNPFLGERPEITIQLPAEGNEPKEVTDFRTGQQVRFLTAPIAGEVGVLDAIDSELNVGVVRLSSNQRISVPLVNLDVIE